MSFLNQVAEATIHLPPRSTLIIFPTQRACQEFRRLVASKKTRVDWMPVVLPIRDLLSKLDTSPVADDLTLLLELYEIYCKNFGQEDFESFMSYGNQLIDDFNEIDRQLINAKFLFEEINDLKTLDERFAPGEEEYDYVKNFWSEFIRTPHTPLQSSFLKYWQQLPILYDAFHRVLVEKNISYEGMAWKAVVESITEQSYFNLWDKVVFAGFYALNRTEELIMEHLEKQNKLLLFRDGDQLYTEPTNHEAGMFLRKGFMSAQSIPWIGNYFEQPKKYYSVKGCGGRSSIARELANDLKQSLVINEGTMQANDCVVVLADESLLFPFLHNCQRLGLKTNPSMGFPLKHHPLMKLLHQVKAFRKLSKETDGEVMRLRQLKEFCSEPMLTKIFTPEELGISSNDKFVEKIENYHASLVDLLSIGSFSISEEKRTINALLHKFKFGEDDWIQKVHLHLLNAVEAVFSILEKHETEIELNVWWQLFIESLELQRIPFLSDRNEGIAVMGFLETRVMDYKQVFIAPLNEGSLPSQSVAKSLIPYSLRKAYKLPCKEEQDAVTAYHFYRLLQRAEYINLYYNTDLNDTGGGERSRYLYQLHHELIIKNPPLKLSYLQEASSVKAFEAAPIIIHKSENILQLLKDKYIEGFADPLKPKGLSASAINSYIACTLRFYFDQVAYLKPKDHSEGLSAGHFGNVLHKAMELTYSKNESIESENILLLIDQVPTFVEAAIELVYGKPVNTGHDYLMKGVLTELIHRILKYDAENAPFKILGLETQYFSKLSTLKNEKVLLKGIIDRLDIFQNELRILDYKTGQDKVMEDGDLEKMFTDSKYKLNLQLLFYCMLVTDNHKDLLVPYRAGIFKMREFGEGILWLNDDSPVTPTEIDQFRLRLGLLVDEIFNPEIPFRQTEDHDKCRFCDYNGLCSRK